MKKPPSLKKVNEIYKEYKKFVWREIPNQTKINWKIKELKFGVWEKDYWAAKNNKIFVGNYYKSPSKILTSIIHEAIHLNTINKKTILMLSGSKEKAQAREIATCILTNIIIRNLNKRLNKRHKENRFDDWYKKYEKISKELETKRGNKNFYEFCAIIKKGIK